MVMKAIAILSMLASSEAFAPNLSLSRKSIAANVITSQWSMDDPAPEVRCQLCQTVGVLEYNLLYQGVGVQVPGSWLC